MIDYDNLPSLSIALAGYSAEGKASLKWLRSRGVIDVTIYDQNPPQTTVQGADYHQVDSFSKIDDKHDLIIRSPSIAPDRLPDRMTITSATQIFFDLCPARIIGVTGTKGKGTTSSLITSILQKSALKVTNDQKLPLPDDENRDFCGSVHLLGNIGMPALSELDKIAEDDIVVFELSSFQLWDLTKSPHIAVMLMIAPDHLNVHSDMDEYVSAKTNIIRQQSKSDYLVHHPTNQYVAMAASECRAAKIPFIVDMPGSAHIIDDKNGQRMVTIDGNQLCAVKELKLLGEHNLENVCAAITASWLVSKDTESITSALRSFTGLPHRLQLVTSNSTYDFFDDSQATGPDSTIAALSTLQDTPISVILGGSDKGIDLSAVVEKIRRQDYVTIIGTNAMAIEKLMKNSGKTNYKNLGMNASMPEVVNTATTAITRGSILLSPASASFDMFDSYIDRGNQFIAAALDITSNNTQ